MNHHLLKYINQFKSSNSAKTVGKNLFYLGLLQFGGYIFPLITMPYLAKVIGVYGFGKIAFASAILVYAQTITDWGFNFTTTRDIARAKENLKKVEEIYSIVTCARLLLMVVSMMILLLLVTIIPYFHENAEIILISLILLPGHVLFPEWLFQGMQEMKYITYLNFATKLIFTILVFVFIKSPNDYILQPLLLGLGSIIAALIGILYIWNKWKIRLQICSIAQIVNTIKQSSDVFINTLMPNFYNSFSIILLGFFGGAKSNGYFDGGNKFNTICYQFLQVISRAFFPFLSTRIDRHSFYAKLSLTLATLISLGLFFFAPQIISVFLTDAFTESINVTRIMAVSIIFLSISNIYGTNYLILINQERLLRNSTVVASIIGFVISIPLIYYFDYIGAALTICITRGLLALFTWRASLKFKNMVH